MKTNKFLTIALLNAILILSSVMTSSAQTKTNTPLDEAKKAIAESNSTYFNAFAKNDSSIFINRYADDCAIMAPNSPAKHGHEGALNFFKLAYNKIGLRNGKFITTAVYGDGINFVTEEGFWQSFDAKNKLFDNGKFLVLWKKTPKGWKMFRDSFSSDRDNK